MAGTWKNVPRGQLRKMLVCIRLIRQTVPGYYDNMTLVDTVRKHAGPDYPGKTQKIWLKYYRTIGTIGNKAISIVLAFQRRDLFADGTHDPPDYYLSVGLSDEHLNADLDNGTESDDYVAADLVSAIVVACNQFDADLPVANHRGRLYIARHLELNLNDIRLKDIFTYANDDLHRYVQRDSDEKKVEATKIAGAAGTRVVWPELWVRKVINY